MEELRALGDFIVYEKGERYHAVEGVLTSAEQLGDGRVRMFYVYPEDFPELYRTKAERRRAMEQAAGKVVALLSG